MPQPLTGFLLSDAYTSQLGWKVPLAGKQRYPGERILVNNQSQQEFDIYGNGLSYIGSVPSWLVFIPFTLDEIFMFLEFRPVTPLNILGPVTDFVSIKLYTLGEEITQTPLSLARQIDQARQVRSVAVPMGMSHFNQGRWASGDPTTLVFQTATISAAQLVAGIAPIYLYYAAFYTNAGNTGTDEFTLEVQWRNNAGTAIGGPFAMARGVCMINLTSNIIVPWVFAPVWPFGALGAFPAGATKADLQVTHQTGTRISMVYTVAFWMDQSNTIGNGDIGTQALYSAAHPDVNPYF